MGEARFKVTTTKLARGHYRITRNDGYSIEVRRGSKGRWYQCGNMATNSTLRMFEFDMRNGYTPRDLLRAAGA